MSQEERDKQLETPQNFSIKVHTKNVIVAYRGSLPIAALYCQTPRASVNLFVYSTWSPPPVTATTTLVKI